MNGEEMDRYEETAIGKAFKKRGFKLASFGGNVIQWTREEPEIDVIISGEQGEPPEKLSEPVIVFVSHSDNSEAVLKLRFASATAFFKSLDDAKDYEGP